MIPIGLIIIAIALMVLLMRLASWLGRRPPCSVSVTARKRPARRQAAADGTAAHHTYSRERRKRHAPTSGITPRHHHWARFGPAALQMGFAGVHAIPMRLRDRVIGTLSPVPQCAWTGRWRGRPGRWWMWPPSPHDEPEQPPGPEAASLPG